MSGVQPKAAFAAPWDEGPVSDRCLDSSRENKASSSVSADPLSSADAAGATPDGRQLDTLREAIRRIEHRPSETWDTPRKARTDGPAQAEIEKAEEEFRPALPVCRLGADRIDQALGGGFPEAGLSEIRVETVRDGGAGLGFALALAVRLGASPRRPLVWIAPAATLTDAGYPYRPGLVAFGLDPAALVMVRARRLEDALWAAEEAARSGAPALTLLEVQNNPAALSLEGSRRLHWRSRHAARPVLVLRQGGSAETTAAPLRLQLSAAPAGRVPGLEAHSCLGAPAFAVAIEKSRDGRLGQFHLEWNVHERRFVQAERAAALSRPVLSPPADGPAATAEIRSLLAARDGGSRRAEPRRHAS